MMSDKEFETSDKELFRFDMLWLGWECDPYAWIMERPDGTRYLQMTNHGSPYEADPVELVERIQYYKTVLADSEKALTMLDEKTTI